MRLRVEVNRATGQREAAELALAEHADGAELLTDPAAEVSAQEGEWAELTAGAKLFTNREYVAGELPQALAGARFLRGSIDRIRATVDEAGVVWVLTPLVERNRDSLEAFLYRQGFVKARVPEFILFDTSPANACTLFQKRCAAGERIELGKWGVLVLPGG